MDPRLAEILQTLNETSSVAAQQPSANFLPQLQQLQQTSNYDPRRIYQLDPAPAPVHAPPPRAPPPSTATAGPVQTVDPRTITQWPAALKYITMVVTNNPIAMDRLRKMKAHQREHEQQWWKSREAIVKRQSNSSNSQSTMNSVLKSFGVSSTSAEPTAEEKRKELATYDAKVHRASQQMYDAMAIDLKKLEIPFFILPDDDFPGDKAELPNLKKRVIELLDDLT
ncbi:hypothetical protein TWF696_005102 [Orbilia brochopaga]|uniref:Uncharacterized protein n=1 Tax=Orbilia brochopaga TaxID=3140254 RepID=A0AAV9V2Z8_9PEZI